MISNLIADYLFNYKSCPLPGVGMLSISQSNAIAAHGENKVAAPLPSIHFSNQDTEAGAFVNYIASRKSLSPHEAESALSLFCRSLRHMDIHSEITVEAVGKFFINSTGKLQFRQIKIPGNFLLPVNAQRVIHPNDSHEMLVGDTQTTTAAMSDFFNTGSSNKQQRWVWWAIILFAIAVAVIIFYCNDKNSNPSFGIAHSYSLAL